MIFYPWDKACLAAAIFVALVWVVFAFRLGLISSAIAVLRRGCGL
jgi:hypothetical protein